MLSIVFLIKCHIDSIALQILNYKQQKLYMYYITHMISNKDDGTVYLIPRNELLH